MILLADTSDGRSIPLDWLLADYPLAVAYTGSGEPVDPWLLSEPPLERILIWASESDSANDDGEKAIAAIRAAEGES